MNDYQIISQYINEIIVNKYNSKQILKNYEELIKKIDKKSLEEVLPKIKEFVDNYKKG